MRPEYESDRKAINNSISKVGSVNLFAVRVIASLLSNKRQKQFQIESKFGSFYSDRRVYLGLEVT